MKIYLVGGAVRDKLLELTATDNDWVIVGSTPSQLRQLGYKQILASFPVFLHPKTNEEYALARTERKIAKGYHGFETCFASSTTIEEDLKRRDLTINSIAIDTNGNIIDPFNGQYDLQNRILRHTSTSFEEDPLRVIRLARFMAQLHSFNFTIAEDTKLLAKKIRDAGELSYLTKERLNLEFKKSLNYPNIFFNTLKSLGCIDIVFPKISKNITKLPQQDFFNHQLYKAATQEQKIAMIFYNFATNYIDLIKDELNLSNNHYKLVFAVNKIHQLITHQHSAEEILHIFRKTNILRDKVLLKNATKIYNKIATILDNHQLIEKLTKLELMITSIQTIDIKKLTQNTPNHLLAKTINKLYIDTIKKH